MLENVPPDEPAPRAGALPNATRNRPSVRLAPMTQNTKETKSERYGVIELGTRGYRILVADATPTGIERVVFSTRGADASELLAPHPDRPPRLPR